MIVSRGGESFYFEDVVIGKIPNAPVDPILMYMWASIGGLSGLLKEIYEVE